MFFCTGFWHGASWNFIIWGMFHGSFLLLERLGLDKILSRIWKPFRIIYTILLVMVGWVFFRADTLSDAITYLSKMFFISSSQQVQVFLVEYLDTKIIFMLLFATFYSLRIYRWIIEKLHCVFESKNLLKFYSIFFYSSKFVISIALFVITVSYLAASTYNPFIYFRF